MPTITTDTYLDAASRTAGEAWTCNGGKLLVRTDSRWHAGSPASFTGSIGAVTVSNVLGGGYEIENSTRWIPFSGGSGNVPAIGTTMTGATSGSSGYFLGVWASLTSGPSAVGSSTPGTGFIKLREANALFNPAETVTAGAWSATTAGDDVRGWIEVCHDQTRDLIFPRLGTGFKCRGNGWFYLGVTTGVAGQQVQVPHNNGGANTHVPAVEIETGVGTNEYEWYPAITTALGFIPANLGTDQRSKYVESMGSGIVRIGHNGTAAVGFVPPAGCRIRIPSVIGRQSTTAARAVNAVPHATVGTRPEFVTTAGGAIDIEDFITDWHCNFANAYALRIKNLACSDTLRMSNVAAPLEIENTCNGILVALASVVTAFDAQTCIVGGTIKKIKHIRRDAASSGHPIYLNNCAGIECESFSGAVLTYARNSGRSVLLNNCAGVKINGINSYNAQAYITLSSQDTEMRNIDHCDRLVGETNATTGQVACRVDTSSDILVDGITFGLNGLIPNQHPYAGTAQTSGNFGNIRIRNAGTVDAPLSGGSALHPARCYVSSGNELGVSVNNLHLTATRTDVISVPVSAKDCVVSNVSGSNTHQVVMNAVDGQARGCRALRHNYAIASVYGIHASDTFLSDTAGEFIFVCNEPTVNTAHLVSLTLAGDGGFTAAGTCAMPSLGDELIIEFPYFVIAHTGFQNAAPTVGGTNTGNFLLQYDLDHGAGFSGTWKTINGANLSAETISPVTGVKMRMRATVVTANATNALRSVQVRTTSALAAQAANQYPLDYATVAISGLIAGSRVQLYDETNSEELFNDVVAGTSVSLSLPFDGDYACRVRVMKQDGLTAYILEEFTMAVGIKGASRDVTQKPDPIYNANAIDGSTITGIVIDDTALRVRVETGVLSWQELYAYETHWLMTEEGIRDESRFIEAPDQANYRLHDFKIINEIDPPGPLVISGGQGVDADTGNAIDIIDTSGGTIFCTPNIVIPFATGGGGGGDTKEAIYTYFTSSGRQNTFRADVSGIPTNPLLDDDPRLAALDATISSRLAASGYTAPDNAGIAAIPTNPLLAVDYVAPANSDIAAIRAVTDALDVPTDAENAAAVLAAAQATPIHADTRKINDVTLAGAGTPADPMRPA